jgi:Cu+-exporting ATPase
MGFESSLQAQRHPGDLDHRDTTRKWRNAFLVSLIFGLPSMIIMMYFMLTMDMEHQHDECHLPMCLIDGVSLENFLLFLLATPVQVSHVGYFQFVSFRCAGSGMIDFIDRCSLSAGDISTSQRGRQSSTEQLTWMFS